VERTITLTAPATESPDDPRPSPAAGTPADPLRLTIDLQEGSFVVEPGPPGSQVRVEGTYAENFYELTETAADGTDGTSGTTIRFRSKAPVWARMLSGLGNDGLQPRVTVRIPEGVAIDLSLRVAMGESRIDLGGLTLSDVGLDFSMGNHELDFTKPVVEGLRRVRLSARMGNVTVDNLGNARASAIEASGNMGNLSADLGGAWLPGAEADASFTQSMGELRLEVPTEVRLETTVIGEGDETERRPAGASETSDPKAPLIRLRVTTSMGENRVRRY
jgi:hypothetical protein